MRSIRSFFREPPARRRYRNRNSERGFALILALGLAVIYFMLIELLMLDASRELGEARLFRARIIALTLAENGAETAALQLADPAAPRVAVPTNFSQGTISGELSQSGAQFTIVGRGTSAGVEAVSATVTLEGRREGKTVIIEHSRHSQ